MRRTSFLIALLLLSAPAVFAQNRAFDLTANAVWVDPTSEGTINSDDPTDVNFDADLGYGLAANIFWGTRISTEFAVARVNPETNIRRRAVGSSGDAEMMPITAVLQFHLAPNGTIDPYIGAGAAYVLFDDVDSNSLNGVQHIELKDDVGLALNGGIAIKLGSRFGIVGDVKYVPLSSSARAVYVTGPDSEAKIDINPVIVSAGLQLRF
ncbi:MAG TPA: OmpW family outer membrane protein [Thermoanaerobaculia bacterium]|nr:OmpW family outer membrane protein [Thermoanaerobaculia bacterium]